ncbi:MAG: hypothetical protein IJ220_02600 [Clostridia bacterium]|nr:hypothetical protein [Clostridia bacterium]
MKSFMKLIITILVVAVIGFTCGFLLMNGTKVEDETLDNDVASEVMIEENSGEIIGEIIDIKSGEQNESLKEDSGDNGSFVSKEEKIKKIDEQVQMIVSGEAEINNFRENLSIDLVSDLAKDFMKYFKINELSVTINVKPNFIEIIPDTDFIENMVYYYDENGNLILYESVSTTVGGSCKYYFNNGAGISVVEAYEENIDVKEEFIGDVLNRAKLIYDKYAIK